MERNVKIMTKPYEMKLKKCCDKFKILFDNREGFTILPEGNIFFGNDYADIELIYCPLCGEKIEWEEN